MTAFDGSGALAMIGQNPIPQGTPDELRKQGVDPNKIGSCAPRSPGVHGCAVYKDCPFHLAKFGGFKGSGPKYVGYYLRTHEGKQKEDFMLCHTFTRVMLSRMRQGNAQREEGNANAEIVRIVAQEGGMVRQRVAVPVNPNDHGINAAYKIETKPVEVPRWPRPGENAQSNYDVELWQDEIRRRNADPDFAVGPIEIETEDEPFNSDDVLEMSAPAAGVVSEPVKGGKK